MSKKHFKIKPKVWPKEYTFEEFKRLNPNINESLLINYYNKYLQEYAENRSRFIEYFEDNKKLLSNNLTEVKNRYDDSQYFLKMYHYNSADAVGGTYPPFKPTDIKGLTHWFKAEDEFLTTELITFDGTTDIKKVVSWSSAVGDSHLIEDVNDASGFYIDHFPDKFIGHFRGKTHTGGNTGGGQLKLTDSPSFGTFTYFAVVEFNTGQAVIQLRSNQIHSTSSIIYQGKESKPKDRTFLIEESNTTSSNYRVVFTNDQQNITYSNLFSERVVTASFVPFMSEGELIDGNISSSTLALTLNKTFNTINFYTSSRSGDKVELIKYPQISSYTNLPHDGNFFNAKGEAQDLIISDFFTGSSIVQNAEADARFHAFWAGQNKVGGRDTKNNFMFFQNKIINIDGPVQSKFSMAASSSKDTGDTTGTVEHLANEPKNNARTVIMITKDAPENALLKVYINNLSSFEDPNPTGSLELDELAHFEPKFFGKYNGQDRVLNGKIYEMGFYTGSLSRSDRNQLYYYLSLKHNTEGYSGPSNLYPYNFSYGEYN